MKTNGTTHAPKVAALIALDEGLLHPPARRRMERHLAGCAVCRETLASMKVADKLAEEARDQKWPEPRWEKMELALAREAKHVAGAIRAERTSARWALGGMLAAAAAVLLVVGAQMNAPVDGTRHGHVVEIGEVDIDGHVITGSVTAVAGDVRIDGAGAAPGSELNEGARVEVAPSGARMHARLAGATGIVGMPGTTFDVLRLREHAVVLGLAGGEVASQVRHLEGGERYEVQAGDYVVHVRGTHFGVRRVGEEVAVAVDEGFVEVTRGADVVATVRAPGTWVSSPSIEASAAIAMPHAIELDAIDWPTVTLPAMPNISMWSIGGQLFEGGSVLRMREPAGPLPIIAYDMHGVQSRFTVEVRPEGATVEPLMVRSDAHTATAAVRPHSTTLTAEQFSTIVRPVVARNTDAIRRCYDFWANRVNYGAPGSLQARITIDENGAVTHADLDLSSLEEARLPMLDTLSSCIAPKIATWQFPPQEHEVSFTVPFRLQTTH